ncbi:MAG: hypothetical protein JWM11_3203 [Planctomycetaceae bacterium]|nr:hypothetical protein [Planctomycetaceae bacterium]
MSASELKTLTKLIKNTWKSIALADKADADEVLTILVATLEELETIEAAE